MSTGRPDLPLTIREKHWVENIKQCRAVLERNVTDSWDSYRQEKAAGNKQMAEWFEGRATAFSVSLTTSTSCSRM